MFLGERHCNLKFVPETKGKISSVNQSWSVIDIIGSSIPQLMAPFYNSGYLPKSAKRIFLNSNSQEAQILIKGINTAQASLYQYVLYLVSEWAISLLEQLYSRQEDQRMQHQIAGSCYLTNTLIINCLNMSNPWTLTSSDGRLENVDS